MFWKITLISFVYFAFISLHLGCASAAEEVDKDGDKVPGAFDTAKVTDEGVVNVVNEAVKKINEKSNSKSMMKLSTVISAKIQVVAGFRYEIAFSFGQTRCGKNATVTAGKDMNDCVVIITKPLFYCDLIANEKPWLNIIELESLVCSDSDKKTTKKYVR